MIIMAKVPFNEAKFKQIAGNCTAEYVNYMPRGKNGMRCWEIKAQKPDGNYTIVVLCDYGYKVDGKTVEITHFETVMGAMKKFTACIMKKAYHNYFWQICLT